MCRFQAARTDAVSLSTYLLVRIVDRILGRIITEELLVGGAPPLRVAAVGRWKDDHPCPAGLRKLGGNVLWNGDGALPG